MSKCPRCGKERVIVSSHDEMISKSKITYTQTICPDPECQKVVEKNLKNDEKKRAVLKDEQEKRLLQRLAAKKVLNIS
ncbi:MAG: hypothetical protein ACD_13C00021G0012 [uncultured bacterium]|uniref:Uncharacterized protein n=1 Tax=Candidatus Woesebacteria bacterium GW2011_GWA1_40_43 TaxID=1618553 RepID=A0A0G0VHN8_9BACT|nr:MAG: hypothetical protein ACD_13C00021G0012 [uncultured bacterium]KKR52914.1 MAG: hypothetical protein UT88_C0017G0009 [Candidatus Woesebacteria bacterium GW2011_GWD2_40_19]KKR56440.1 MAG: hypothetical protein UT96_C0044G0004 [Candidatus Woesebacteria bacterium GW2011_GWC2_40_30]KKR62272.1 MAG: hypothetical protein UU02_C0047G0002 [Candidatus Woesebacteria bacterium GW2011_GWA1_40_43]HAU64998.1 hypothetical protein [Candidatus Woesebacteria bacterium]